MSEKEKAGEVRLAGSDSESQSFGEPASVGAPNGQGKLARKLKNRHIAMISIGGVIGTGLFLGTGTALHNGGPVGLLLGYAVVGTICYSVMISLGEMVAFLPVEGGHIKLAERFVNRPFAFTLGWNYWYNWAIIMPAELSAASVLISYWDKTTTPSVWITVCSAVVIFINMLGAGAYGEAEFVFASIKVITIVGLIILGIILDLGGGPDGDRLGFRYWKNPGPFVQYQGIAGAKGRFLGWFAVLIQASFSFIGTEIVAIAAGEAKNPRRNIPKVIRRVYIRIVLFYIMGTFIIGLLTPSNSEGLNINDGTSASSPFVIAIERAGIKSLPSIINAALLTSAWSAASSDLYTSSRALYGLSVSGNAPKFFLKTTKNGLPWTSVVFNALFASLGYLAVSDGAGKVFGWLANMTSVAGLLTWFGISYTYIRFHAGLKANGIDRATLPFASKFQPYAAWWSMCWCLLITVFSGWSVFLRGNWDTATFVTNYLPLVLFPIFYASSRLYFREKIKKPEEMDFVSGLAEIEADVTDEPPPRNKAEAFWQWLM